jgi:hypothetical protein
VVSARDGATVHERLRLRTVLPANWTSGPTAVRAAGVFVTPPVDGWVFVVGADLATADPESTILPLLEALSRNRGTAAWFRCAPDADEFGWALARDGMIERAYAYAGEHGHVLWQGELTAAERDLGCFVDDPRDRSDDEVKWWPDRAIVAALAGAWTLRPEAAPARVRSPAVGSIGRM